MIGPILGAVLPIIVWTLTPAVEPPPEAPRWVYCLTCPAILTDLPEVFLAPATTVMLCESRGRATVVNPSSGTVGLFQIHPIHRRRVEYLGYRFEQLLDPRVNLAVAFNIWAEQGFGPWECKP